MKMMVMRRVERDIGNSHDDAESYITSDLGFEEESRVFAVLEMPQVVELKRE
jgi:hypothetical protein